MANGYNMPNRGFRVGSSVMQAMMDSYNRNTMMQADILRYKTDVAFRERDYALREKKFNLDEERHSSYGKPPWYADPEYKDTKIGRIGGGLDPRASSVKLQIKGQLDPEEELATKYIGRLTATKTPDIAIKDTLMQALRENPSKVAKDYVIEKDKESGVLDSLETILDEYPQDTASLGWGGKFGDDTISPEDTRKGIVEYIEKLMGYGLTQEEAETKAIEEFGDLRKKEKYHPAKAYPLGDLFTGEAEAKIPAVGDRASHLAEYKRLGGSTSEAARTYAEQYLQ